LVGTSEAGAGPRHVAIHRWPGDPNVKCPRTFVNILIQQWSNRARRQPDLSAFPVSTQLA